MTDKPKKKYRPTVHDMPSRNEWTTKKAWLREGTFGPHGDEPVDDPMDRQVVIEANTGGRETSTLTLGEVKWLYDTFRSEMSGES